MKQSILWLSLLVAPNLVASAIYNVSLDTSPLISNAAGPFWLSFQLSDGSATGDGNNIAVVDGFQFGTGGPSGAPILIGSGFGDLSSQVVLTDVSGVAYFAQSFQPGATLQFQLTISTNVDSGPTPDAFALAILDNTLTPIPTTAGAPLDILAEIDIASDNPAVAAFEGDISRTPAAGGGPIAISAPDIVPIPEPALWLPLLIGLASLARVRAAARQL